MGRMFPDKYRLLVKQDNGSWSVFATAHNIFELEARARRLLWDTRIEPIPTSHQTEV